MFLKQTRNQPKTIDFPNSQFKGSLQFLNPHSQRSQIFLDSSVQPPLQGIQKHFAVNELKDASMQSLPQLTANPSRSPFQRRHNSLSEAIQLHNSQKAHMLDRLSPDDKNFRIQQLIVKSPTQPAIHKHDASAFKLSEKPQSTDIDVKTEKKVLSLENDMHLLEQKLQKAGAFLSVEERTLKATKDSFYGKKWFQKKVPEDSYISVESSKALKILEPDQIHYSNFQSHGDAINSHFENKLDRATDIILSVVYAQNKDIQNSIQVLDYMNARANSISPRKRQFIDYFEAKKILGRIQRRKQEKKTTVTETVENENQSITEQSVDLPIASGPTSKHNFFAPKIQLGTIPSQIPSQIMSQEPSQVTTPRVGNKTSKAQHLPVFTPLNPDPTKKRFGGDSTLALPSSDGQSGSKPVSKFKENQGTVRMYSIPVSIFDEDSFNKQKRKVPELLVTNLISMGPQLKPQGSFGSSSDGSLVTSDVGSEQVGKEVKPSPNLSAHLSVGLTEMQQAEPSETQSVISTGVHDLCLYEQYLNSPSKLRETGIYAKLKADSLVLKQSVGQAYESYNFDFPPARRFFDYTEAQRQGGGQYINPYPILHQLYKGRLLILNQTYSVEGWKQILKCAVEFSKEQVETPLQFIYIEGCNLQDETLGLMLRTIHSLPHLLELILVRVKISKSVTKEFFRYLNTSKKAQQADVNDKKLRFMQSHRKVKFLFYECLFGGQDKDVYSEEPASHPLLESKLIPLKHLCLANCNLVDDHLDQIFGKLIALESLDISYNRFTPDKLLKFVEKVIQFSTVQTSGFKAPLRSVSLAGHSLANCNSYLAGQILAQLVKLTCISHVDLSQMDLAEESVRAIVEALLVARSIQCLHLSGQHVKNYMQVSKEVLRYLVFDRMSMKRIQPEVPADWNETLKLPNAWTDEISAEVNTCFCNTKAKVDHIQRLKETTRKTDGYEAAEKTKRYQDTRYVLSRIIGRQDLSNNFLRMRVDPITKELVDVTSCLEKSIHFEFEQRRRTMDDVCWIESQECWACERWAYLLPVINRNHIDDCFLGEEQEKDCLTEQQEKTLARIIDQNKDAYESLEQRVPYIVGECTSLQFIKLQKFADFCSLIDPESELVRKSCKERNIELHEWYSKDNKWRDVIKASQMQREKQQSKRVSSTQLSTSQPIFPYEPVVSFNKNAQIGIYDQAWAGSFLVRPGRTSYFIIYKFDDSRTFKTEVKCDLQPRSLLAHHYVMPKTKYEQEQQKEQKKKNEDSYFSVFNLWHLETDQSRKRLIELDINACRLKSSALFQQGKEEIYAALVLELKAYSHELSAIWKELQSQSESFPLLNSIQLADWFKFINVVGDQDAHDREADSRKLNQLSHGPAIERQPTTLSPFEFQKIYDEVRQGNIAVLLNKQASKRNMPSTVLSRANSISKTDKQSVSEQSIIRHQWYDLLVRIAVKLFHLPEKATKKHVLTPAECFKKLMRDHLSPFYIRLGKVLERPRDFINKELLKSKPVQKYLFLNQFQLHNIYEHSLAQPYTIVYGGDDADASKLRKFGMANKRISSFSMVKKVSKISSNVIDEKDEFFKDAVIRNSPRNNSLKMKTDSPGRASNNGSESQLSFQKKASRKPAMARQVSDTSTNLNFALSNLPATGTDESKVNSDEVETFLAVPKVGFADVPKRVTKKEVVVEKGINCNDLFEHCLKFVPPEKMAIFTRKTFQFCFSQSKMAKAPSGSGVQSFENDKKRMSHLSFIEFIVFLCMFAGEIYADEIRRGEPVLTFIEIVFNKLLENYEVSPVQVPPEDQDPRMANVPRKLLIKGEIVDYTPMTPELMQQSMHIEDLYSESSEYKLMAKKLSKALSTIVVAAQRRSVDVEMSDSIRGDSQGGSSSSLEASDYSDDQ